MGNQGSIEQQNLNPQVRKSLTSLSKNIQNLESLEQYANISKNQHLQINMNEPEFKQKFEELQKQGIINDSQLQSSKIWQIIQQNNQQQVNNITQPTSTKNIKIPTQSSKNSLTSSNNVYTYGIGNTQVFTAQQFQKQQQQLQQQQQQNINISKNNVNQIKIEHEIVENKENKHPNINKQNKHHQQNSQQIIQKQYFQTAKTSPVKSKSPINQQKSVYFSKKQVGPSNYQQYHDQKQNQIQQQTNYQNQNQQQRYTRQYSPINKVSNNKNNNNSNNNQQQQIIRPSQSPINQKVDNKQNIYKTQPTTPSQINKKHFTSNNNNNSNFEFSQLTQTPQQLLKNHNRQVSVSPISKTQQEKQQQLQKQLNQQRQHSISPLPQQKFQHVKKIDLNQQKINNNNNTNNNNQMSQRSVQENKEESNQVINFPKYFNTKSHASQMSISQNQDFNKKKINTQTLQQQDTNESQNVNIDNSTASSHQNLKPYSQQQNNNQGQLINIQNQQQLDQNNKKNSYSQPNYQSLKPCSNLNMNLVNQSNNNSSFLYLNNQCNTSNNYQYSETNFNETSHIFSQIVSPINGNNNNTLTNKTPSCQNINSKNNTLQFPQSNTSNNDQMTSFGSYLNNNNKNQNQKYPYKQQQYQTQSNTPTHLQQGSITVRNNNNNNNNVSTSVQNKLKSIVGLRKASNDVSIQKTSRNNNFSTVHYSSNTSMCNSRINYTSSNNNINNQSYQNYNSNNGGTYRTYTQYDVSPNNLSNIEKRAHTNMDLSHSPTPSYPKILKKSISSNQILNNSNKQQGSQSPYNAPKSQFFTNKQKFEKEVQDNEQQKKVIYLHPQENQTKDKKQNGLNISQHYKNRSIDQQSLTPKSFAQHKRQMTEQNNNNFGFANKVSQQTPRTPNSNSIILLQDESQIIEKSPYKIQKPDSICKLQEIYSNQKLKFNDNDNNNNNDNNNMKLSNISSISNVSNNINRNGISQNDIIIKDIDNIKEKDNSQQQYQQNNINKNDLKSTIDDIKKSIANDLQKISQFIDMDDLNTILQEQSQKSPNLSIIIQQNQEQEQLEHLNKIQEQIQNLQKNEQQQQQQVEQQEQGEKSQHQLMKEKKKKINRKNKTYRYSFAQPNQEGEGDSDYSSDEQDQQMIQNSQNPFAQSQQQSQQQSLDQQQLMQQQQQQQQFGIQPQFSAKRNLSNVFNSGFQISSHDNMGQDSKLAVFGSMQQQEQTPPKNGQQNNNNEQKDDLSPSSIEKQNQNDTEKVNKQSGMTPSFIEKLKNDTHINNYQQDEGQVKDFYDQYQDQKKNQGQQQQYQGDLQDKQQQLDNNLHKNQNHLPERLVTIHESDDYDGVRIETIQDCIPESEQIDLFQFIKDDEQDVPLKEQDLLMKQNSQQETNLDCQEVLEEKEVLSSFPQLQNKENADQQKSQENQIVENNNDNMQNTNINNNNINNGMNSSQRQGHTNNKCQIPPRPTFIKKQDSSQKLSHQQQQMLSDVCSPIKDNYIYGNKNYYMNSENQNSHHQNQNNRNSHGYMQYNGMNNTNNSRANLGSLQFSGGIKQNQNGENSVNFSTLLYNMETEQTCQKFSDSKIYDHHQNQNILDNNTCKNLDQDYFNNKLNNSIQQQQNQQQIQQQQQLQQQLQLNQKKDRITDYTISANKIDSNQDLLQEHVDKVQISEKKGLQIQTSNSKQQQCSSFQNDDTNPTTPRLLHSRQESINKSNTKKKLSINFLELNQKMDNLKQRSNSINQVQQINQSSTSPNSSFHKMQQNSLCFQSVTARQNSSFVQNNNNNENIKNNSQDLSNTQHQQQEEEYQIQKQEKQEKNKLLLEQDQQQQQQKQQQQNEQQQKQLEQQLKQNQQIKQQQQLENQKQQQQLLENQQRQQIQEQNQKQLQIQDTQNDNQKQQQQSEKQDPFTKTRKLSNNLQEECQSQRQYQQDLKEKIMERSKTERNINQHHHRNDSEITYLQNEKKKNYNSRSPLSRNNSHYSFEQFKMINKPKILDTSNDLINSHRLNGSSNSITPSAKSSRQSYNKQSINSTRNSGCKKQLSFANYYQEKGKKIDTSINNKNN